MTHVMPAVNRVYLADALSLLASMPDASVDDNYVAIARKRLAQPFTPSFLPALDAQEAS
jgi:hypothetical protein